MYSVPFFLLNKESNIFTLSDIQNHQNFCKLFVKAQISYERKVEEYNNTNKKEKKEFKERKEKDLQNKIWIWFENLSLEEKIKICTIRNKWLVKILIQLYFIYSIDNKNTFSPTPEMDIFFSNGFNVNYKNLYLFKNYKDSKKYIGYNEDDYCKLYFNIKETDFNRNKKIKTKEEIDNENKLLNNVVILSIEEESLDTVSLAEEFLKDIKNFKYILNFFSNKECLKEWIMPMKFNECHNFCYPIWMHNNQELSFCQIICGIFEQQILLTYEYFFYSKKIYFFPGVHLIIDIYKENKNLENFLLKKKDNLITLELINDIIIKIKNDSNYKKKIDNFKRMLDQLYNDYYKSEFYIGNKILTNQSESIFRELISEINNNKKGKEVYSLLNKITFMNLNDVRNFREYIYINLKKHFIEKRNNEIIQELLDNSNNKNSKKKKKKKKKNKNSNNKINAEENKINIEPEEKNFSSNDESENDKINLNSNNSLKEIKNQNLINIKQEKNKTKEFFLFPINKKKEKNNKNNINENFSNTKSFSEKNNIKINEKKEEKIEEKKLSENSIINFEMINNKKEDKNINKYQLNSPELTNSFSFEASKKDEINISNYESKNNNEQNENNNQVNMVINIINNQYIYQQYPFYNFNNYNYTMMNYYNVPSELFFEILSKEIDIYDNFTTKNVKILNKIRKKYFTKVESMIKNGLNKKYEIKFGHYGSYFTNLSIEGSDVDILVFYKPLNSKFDFLKDIINLLNKEQNELFSINPILSASVPVIVLQIDISKELNNNELKFLPYYDSKDISHIKIDLTFTCDINEYKRPEQIVNYINKNVNEYKDIRSLLLVIKRYFRVMKMNKSFTGGLSSYSLFLLILAFFKHNKMSFDDSEEKEISKGKSLFYFLEKYSFYDYKNYGIDVEGKQIYFPLENSFDYNHEEIKILEPFTRLNVSKSSFQVDEIRNTFNKALFFLKIENYQILNKNENTINDEKYNDDFIILKKLFSIK